MRSLLPHFLLIVAVAPSGCAGPRRDFDRLSPDAIHVLALLDQFDPGDRSQLPFVRIDSGGSSGPWFSSYFGSDYGFLERVAPERFEIRLLHLMRECYRTVQERKTYSPNPSHSPADFKAYVRGILQLEDESEFPYVHPDTIFARRVMDAILARDCLGLGMDAEAEALFRRAIGKDVNWFMYALAKGLNDLLCLRFRDPSLNRTDLLALHRLWLKSFPTEEDRGEVEERTATLERMVEEDRKTRSIDPESDSPESLIWALRDEVNPVRNHFFGSEHLNAFHPGGQGPAQRLIAMGAKAAPVLVAASDDNRFTRCVFEHTRHGGSFEVVTIGWMVRSILTHISGLIYDGGNESWTRWLEEVRTKGVEEVLAERVVRNEGASESFLLERWPHRVDAVIRGIQENPKRGEFEFQVLAKSDRPEALAFLRSEATSGKDPLYRLHAARALWERGDRSGLDWAAETLPKVKDTDTLVTLALFLLGSADSHAIQALSRELTSRDRLKKIVLGRLDYRWIRRRWVVLPDQGFTPAFASLLNHLLQDPSPWEEADSSKRLNWRTCDEAAEVAATLWPDRYRFYSNGAPTLRDRHILRLRKDLNSILNLPRLPAEGVPRSSDRWSVAEVDMESDRDDWQPPAAIRTRYSALRGKPLDGKAVVGIFRDMVESRDPSSHMDMAFILDRTRDGQGTSAWVKFEPACIGPLGTSLVVANVTLDGKHMIAVDSSFPGAHLWPEVSSLLERVIAACASAPKDSTFNVQFRCFIPADP